MNAFGSGIKAWDAKKLHGHRFCRDSLTGTDHVRSPDIHG
jgi:hypothetical protein